MDIEFSCISCKKLFSIDNIQQVVASIEDKKGVFFCFCCLKCLSDKKDKDLLVKTGLGNIILVKNTFGLTPSFIKEMMSRHLVGNYHFSLFLNRR